jgi:Mg/Co/Ni transporter MgtE
MNELPEYALLNLLRASPGTDAQNILMSTPSREIAITILSLPESERGEFYRHLSPKKRKAVVEELELQRRLRLEPAHRKLMAENLLARFAGGKQRTIPSYLRPRRKPRD